MKVPVSSKTWPRAVASVASFALAATISLLAISRVAHSQDGEDLSTPAIEEAPGPRLGASEEELQDWLREAIDRAIARHGTLADSRIGIQIRDLATDQVIYSHHADQSFNVASNTKIATEVAGLALLGPDFCFRTSIGVDDIGDDGKVEGDLYIRSNADPTLTTWDLRQLAHEVEIAGITSIGGQVIVDNSYFDSANLPPHFDEQPDEQAGFRAPVAATALDFNTVAILVTPNPGGSGPAQVLAEPANDYVRIVGTVLTVASGRTRIRIESESKRGHLEVTVHGQIRRELRKKRYRLRVPDPVPYLGSALVNLLEEQGIKVRNEKIGTGTLPDRARVLVTRESPPLAEVIRAMGKYSNNFVAEMLLKTIGAETLEGDRRPATWKDGLSTVRAFLQETVGLRGKFYYGNGSGLFSGSGFSPAQIVTILSAAYRDFRIGPDFVSSLSISGADGTLRRRMLGSPAERVVRAKTGTLDSVSALSGYVAIDGRIPVAFSVLVNDVPKWRTGDARSLQDSVASAIAQYLRRGQ